MCDMTAGILCEWHVMASIGLKRFLPRVPGCEDNIYGYKSIIEKVSAQGKITLTGVYINEEHCNEKYTFAI